MALGIRHRSAVAPLSWWIGLLLVVILVPVRAPGQAGPQLSSLALQQQPPEPPKLSLEERADVFMARKAYADAADYYQRALKQSGSSDARLWNKLGIAYQSEGNNRAARKAYEEALHRRKDFSVAWNNIGTTYFLERRYSKSIKYYQRSLQLDPDSASVHLNLGTAYYHKKKYAEAVNEYRQALGLDPNVLAGQTLLGTVIRPVLSEQMHGFDPLYYFYLAKVFASLGRAEEAVRYLRRALEDGFGDLNRIREDPDFQKISQFPAYGELLKNPPVPIKQ
jgi:tetratricopeptide (TPR) repeat protein